MRSSLARCLSLICLLGLLVAPVGSGATASVPPTSGRIHNCGDLVRQGAGVYNVTSRNVGCRTARSFARRASRVCGLGVCHYRSFTCRTRQTGEELADTRCTSGRRVIRWQSGA
jgi:hypothetical protein